MLGYDPTDNTGQSAQKYYGTSVEGVNDFTKACRKLGFSYLKKNLRPDYTMISVPAINAFRTTRRVAGVYELQADDVHKHFEDSIGCTGDWRKAGPVFEIPYRTLIDTKVTNVIAAGRIIASAGDACEVTRAIPPVAMTGQAAGTAAADRSGMPQLTSPWSPHGRNEDGSARPDQCRPRPNASGNSKFGR